MTKLQTLAMVQALADMRNDGLTYNKDFDKMVLCDGLENPGFKRTFKRNSYNSGKISIS